MKAALSRRSNSDESLLRFGQDGRLVGTLARPALHPDGSDSPTMLLFNAGVISRVGPHRLNVKLARALAETGIPSFRFDLSGQGDSGASTALTDFERQAVLDVQAAMNAVHARTGARQFVVFGICSGAVLGYAAARADIRIVGCAMLDPYMYPTWRTHWNRIRAIARRDGVLHASAGWVTRHVGLRRATSTDSEQGQRGATDLGLKRPARADFAEGLRGLLDRDVDVLMLYSGSVMYSYNYPGQFGDGFRRFRLTGRIAAHYLPHVDHTVTAIAAQSEVIAIIVRWASRIGAPSG
jgi:hypothetical protein